MAKSLKDGMTALGKITFVAAASSRDKENHDSSLTRIGK